MGRRRYSSAEEEGTVRIPLRSVESRGGSAVSIDRYSERSLHDMSDDDKPGGKVFLG